MLDVIEKLLVLQDRDQRISRLEAELARIEPDRRSLQAKATAAQAALESAKTQVKQLESDRKNLELEVETKKEQIAKYSLQQFQTRKNEEYRALAHEIEMCQQDIVKIEDRELELMEQSEMGQKEVARATREAGEMKEVVAGQLKQMDVCEQNLKKELAGLETNREELAVAVGEHARSRYERLLRNKGHNVVVGVQHAVCGGCHMRLPPQLMVECQAEQDFVTCSNCGRILYYTPDMDVAVAE